MTGDNNTKTTNGGFPRCTSTDCLVAEEEKQRVMAATVEREPCELTERCVASCAAYGRICPCAARIAAHSAHEAIIEIKHNSAIFTQAGEDGGDEDDDEEVTDVAAPTATRPAFPYLDAEDLVIGRKLGEGGFSNVNLCTVTKGDEAGQQFAVKYLKRKAMVDLHQFKHGAADLAVEAFFLQALDHPNIVKLHGVTAGSVETNVATGKECGFFIVVDHLTKTLEELLEVWRQEAQETPNRLVRLTSEYKTKKKAELHERLKIALAIAEALEYLHSKGIIFRDLKPDNCGFDKDGVLKLFDFGLAKELKPGMENADGRYQLTGNTGSRRYMAPEVAKELPYDKTVDVFSFGILLWELCSGEKPFYGYSSGKHMHLVVMGGERPKMDAHHTAYWPANLQWLLRRSWSPFSALRPSFTVIKQVLQDILNGKESLPVTLLDNHAQSSEEKKEENPAIEAPVGGFGGLFHPLSRKKGRAKTTGGAEDMIQPPKDGFQGLKPSKNGGARSRSWGFGLKR